MPLQVRQLFDDVQERYAGLAEDAKSVNSPLDQFIAILHPEYQAVVCCEILFSLGFLDIEQIHILAVSASRPASAAGAKLAEELADLNNVLMAYKIFKPSVLTKKLIHFLLRRPHLAKSSLNAAYLLDALGLLERESAILCDIYAEDYVQALYQVYLSVAEDKAAFDELYSSVRTLLFNKRNILSRYQAVLSALARRGLLNNEILAYFLASHPDYTAPVADDHNPVPSIDLLLSQLGTLVHPLDSRLMGLDKKLQLIEILPVGLAAANLVKIFELTLFDLSDKCALLTVIRDSQPSLLTQQLLNYLFANASPRFWSDEQLSKLSKILKSLDSTSYFLSFNKLTRMIESYHEFSEEAIEALQLLNQEEFAELHELIFNILFPPKLSLALILNDSLSPDEFGKLCQQLKLASPALSDSKTNLAKIISSSVQSNLTKSIDILATAVPSRLNQMNLDYLFSWSRIQPARWDPMQLLLSGIDFKEQDLAKALIYFQQADLFEEFKEACFNFADPDSVKLLDFWVMLAEFSPSALTRAHIQQILSAKTSLSNQEFKQTLKRWQSLISSGLLPPEAIFKLSPQQLAWLSDLDLLKWCREAKITPEEALAVPPARCALEPVLRRAVDGNWLRFADATGDVDDPELALRIETQSGRQALIARLPTLPGNRFPHVALTDAEFAKIQRHTGNAAFWRRESAIAAWHSRAQLNAFMDLVEQIKAGCSLAEFRECMKSNGYYKIDYVFHQALPEYGIKEGDHLLGIAKTFNRTDLMEYLEAEIVKRNAEFADTAESAAVVANRGLG